MTLTAVVVLAAALGAAPAGAKKGGEPAHGQPAPPAGPHATPPGHASHPQPRGPQKPEKAPKQPPPAPPAAPPASPVRQQPATAAPAPAPAPAPAASDRQVVLHEFVSGSTTPVARRGPTQQTGGRRAGTRAGRATPVALAGTPGPPAAGVAGSVAAQRRVTSGRPRTEARRAAAQGVVSTFTVPNVREGIPSKAAVTRLVQVVPDWVWAILALLLIIAAALGTVLWVYARRLRRADEHAHALAGIAMTDVLTGLLNRRGMEERLNAELARARRYGGTLAVVYGDLRSLKVINDRHGHEAGDRALRTVGDVLRAQVREGDVCARVGGDEYAVILVNQGSDGAEAFRERVRKRLAGGKGPNGLEELELTMGLACYPRDGDDLSQLFAAADRDLYAQRGISVG